MEKLLNYQNTTIYYQLTGTGQPVMLLHGFAEDNQIWEKQVSFLKNYCQLIIPDLPGSGKSIFKNGETALSLQKEGAQSNSNAPSIEYYSECMLAILQQENISSCIVLGHSMGGYITLAMAERRPEMLKAFGLVHSTAFADTEDKKNNRKKGIELMRNYGVYPFLKNVTPTLFSSLSKQEKADQIEALIERGKSFSPNILENYYHAMMNRPDRTNVLKTNGLPVFFVIGMEDVATPLNDLLKQVYLPTVAFIHIFDNVGHMSMMETPDKLNEKLLEFIKAMN